MSHPHPRYPKYKPSGVEVLGDVPAHWEVRELRHIGRVMKGSGGSKEDVVESGVPCVRYGDLYTTHSFHIDMARTFLAPERAKAYTPIQYGDILFAASGEKLEEIGKAAVNLIRGEAVCGGDLVLLRPAAGAWPRFMGYATDAAPSAMQKASMGRGTTVKHIYPDELRHLLLAMPPEPEQMAIAAFLDREITKVDALVAEQKRLIDLLKEKRRAVISHAVTKGLNPNVLMKESGVEWLGQVPAHWQVAQARRLVLDIEQGWSPECHSRPAEGEEWGVLKAGCVNRGVYVQEENKALPSELAPLPEYQVEVGDVLVSRASGSPELIGSTAIVRATRPRLMISDKIFRVKLADSVLSEFFVTAFNSFGVRSQIERAISGADGLANNLPQSELRSLVLVVPPLREQREIVEYVAASLDRFAALSLEAATAVNLLQERRAATISAAVTGQIDVRPESMRSAA